jgi:hypothetical protein
VQAGSNGANSAGGEAKVALPEQAGWQWYVYSYLAAFLARRVEFLASCGEQHWAAAVDMYLAALHVAAAGGAVLARYRFSPATGEPQLPLQGPHEDVCRVLISE